MSLLVYRLSRFCLTEELLLVPNQTFVSMFVFISLLCDVGVVFCFGSGLFSDQ